MGAWGDDIRRELHAAAEQIDVDETAGLDAISRKIRATMVCPLCEGSGVAVVFIGHWRCRACDGTGKIERLYLYYGW